MSDLAQLCFLSCYFTVFFIWLIRWVLGIDAMRNPMLFWVVLVQAMMRAVIVVGPLVVLQRYLDGLR